MTDWLCGALDAALALMHQALAHAHTMAYPFGVGMALSLAAMLHLLRGDIQAGQTHAEATITLATAQGLDALAAQGLLLRGWALAAQGQHSEGLAQMRQGWVAMQATGQEVGRLLYLAVLAEQSGQAGQVEAGLHLLTEALASLVPREPRLWEAELYRGRGTLCLQDGVERPASGGLTLDVPRRTGDAEAETCFRQALALARRQGAKAFELRVVLGLSRLWQRQGKRQAAHQLLAEVYGGSPKGLTRRT